MASYDYFRNRTHSNRITSYPAIKSIFGGCFKRRTGQTNIYTFFQRNIMRSCNLFHQTDKLTVISTGHIRETSTEQFIIRTYQRIRHHIYMITDNHQVTNFESVIYSTGSIRHQKILYTQQFHHTNGKCHLLHGIPFIIMKTTLHSQNLLTSQFAANKITFMTGSCRMHKMRNLCIRNYNGILYPVCQ